MKKIILTVIAAAISYNIVFSQPCLPEGITFSTQEQIDNFQANYPGCTEIGGDVTIQGIEICSLYGLSVLTSIGGDLKIICIEVNDLFGLDSLISIGGDLVVEGNLGLYDLEGLEALNFIGGDLSIGVNFVLESLSGLMSLTSIEGDCLIYNNNFLYSLYGLQNLTSIGGNLEIIANSNLYGLIGLNNLTSLAGGLSIGDNDFLTDLADFNALNAVGGGIGIYNNNNLSSLTGLESISFVGGTLGISSNNNLVSLSGMDNLSFITGELSINYNNALINLSGLENLISIGSDLSIYNNTSLKSLIGLQGLTSIGEDFEIVNNDSLTNLTGLENINSSSINNLSVYGNPSLTTCEVQSLCDYLASPNGVISIHDNAPGCNSQQEIEDACEALTHCLPEGITFTTQEEIDNFQINYPGCTEIEGDVFIGGNYITNLYGLSVLTSIGGSISIYNNNALTNLCGLESLTSIGESLIISENDAMMSLTGTESLNSIGGGLFIINNPSLSTCNVQGLCNYLLNPAGSIIIFNNASGCNNPPEIAANCGFTMPCLPYGNYYFFTQADIDNFQTNYPGCMEIEGDVTIGSFDCTNITNLQGLNVVTSIGGKLDLNYNYVLSSLSGLESLTFIGANFNIEYNNDLTSLSGLESLSYVGGGFYIWVNNSLTSLSGLENLTSIGGQLNINSNLILTSLTGLDNIDAGSILNLYIYQNSLLSTCDVESICEYLANPNGTISIWANAPGCSSPEEVEEACQSGINEISVGAGISIVPNPSNDEITIILSSFSTNKVLSIFNVSGEKVFERQLTDTKNQLDISGLPRGVYFVRVQNEKMVEVGKLIKE